MNNDFRVILTTSPASASLEGNRSMTVPVGQIVVDDERGPVNDAKFNELMNSIAAVGLLSPLVVRLRKGHDGNEEFQLVAGRNRLKALKQLGMVEAQCTV